MNTLLVLFFFSGSSKDHKKQGCRLCDSREYCEPHDYDYTCTCEWHLQKAQVEMRSIEVQVRRKAIVVPDFPSQKVSWQSCNCNF